ncbi:MULTISPECIES: outer membrane exchange accessory lipoprotein TraC [Myxococcaceae]|uniref:outer membrane exchange accessory lipoprotein TraC n=1 Tax=Myxococcaceae TaxID=31 RepID=UPI001E3BBA96
MTHPLAARPASPRRPLVLILPRVLLLLLLALALPGCTAFHRAVKEGDKAAAAQQWAEADAAYARALVVDSSDSEIRLKQRKVREAWSAQVLDEARGKESDLPEAQRLLLRALELDPDSSEARAELARVLGARVAKGQAALKEERLGDAQAEFEGVLAVASPPAASEQLVAAKAGRLNVQAAYAQRWFREAERLEERGLLGNALVGFLRADQERPGATAARERAEGLRRRLREEVAFLVVAGLPVDRADAPDVAARLEPGRLATYLPTRLPLRVVTDAPAGKVGVRLSLALERVLALEEQTPSQRTKRYLAGMKAVPNPERKDFEGKLLQTERTLEDVERAESQALREYFKKGTELTAARTAAERCRERERRDCQRALEACGQLAQEATQVAARAAAGGKAEKPPASPDKVADVCSAARCGASAACADEEKALVQRQDVVHALEGELEDAQRKSELQRREVQRGRDAVYRTPLTVEQPMYADFVYDVETHRRVVKATVTSVLEDLGAAGTPAPRTQDYAAQFEDVAHKGYEKYGILADPVQLKSAEELRVEAGDRAAEAIAKQVRERFDVYRQAKVADARRGMVRPAAEDVVEAAVRALLLTADAPPQDVLEPLARARGLAHPEGIFRSEPEPQASRP